MENDKQSIETIISAWLSNQPKWFSPALHIALQGEYTSEEIDALALAACNEANVHTDIKSDIILTHYQASDLANVGFMNRDVVLESITAINGINAIVPGATLDLASNGLTIVYGNNGSGKSGYCRIIRNAATSRSGPEGILSNVYNTNNSVQSVSIKASINGMSCSYVWEEGKTDYPSFPEIAFFDSSCAAKELRGKENKVLYTPGIITALTRLSRIIVNVEERIQLASEQIDTEMDVRLVPSELQNDASIVNLLESTSESEAEEQILRASLTQKDYERLNVLPGLIETDPSVEKPKLERKIAQLTSMHKKITELNICCQKDYIEKYNQSVVEKEEAEDAVRAAHELINEKSKIDGIGSSAWKALWEAARTFCDSVAFPGKRYPHDCQGALCPLCQQPLGDEAVERMINFEAYVKGAAEQNLNTKKNALEVLSKQFTDAVSNLRADYSSVSILETGDAIERVDKLMKRLELVSSMQTGSVLAELSQLTLEADKCVCSDICSLKNKLEEVTESMKPGAVERLKQEQIMLKSRKWITDNKEVLLADTARREKKVRLATAKKSCTTRQVSTLVSNVSRLEIIERMQAFFDEELRRLKAVSQPVAILTHTKIGQQYQQYALNDTNASTSSVLSEGEQKIVALAGFFTMLDVIPGKSTVVLDDPITSLDHMWRKAVAKRIVEEAATRPIVIFTHEPVFCNELTDLSTKNSIPITYRTVNKKGSQTGVVTDGLDWEACNVNGRISELRKFVDSLKQREKNGGFTSNSELNEELYRGYSKLRSTWERATETVLLNSVVERASKQVHTRMLKDLTDISEDDIRIVDDNMDKCSSITEAHDNPLTTPDSPPSIVELEDDIFVLENWVKSIRRRRN